MDGSTANLLRRFLQRAPDALTDEELLTLLLHAGTGAEEPRTLAARLIGQFGSLGATLSASPEELASVEGMDASRALLLRLVTELHRRYYLSRPFSGARLTGTTDFGNFLLPFFYGAREELVYLLALDAAGRLLTCTCLSEGSVNSANVPMRKLMRAALSANASGVVLAHNHPAGIALASHEDVELTRRLQQALDVVDILLLDHLVIADDMKADGFSLDDKRSEIADNDIPDIIQRFHHLEQETTRERTEQSFFVPKQEIVDNGYDLSINKYKKTEYVAVEYPPTDEIIDRLLGLEEEIKTELLELKNLLK